MVHKPKDLLKSPHDRKDEIIEAAKSLRALELDEHLAKMDIHRERLGPSAKFKFREPALPEGHYFLKYRGRYPSRLDYLPKLCECHMLDHPDSTEIRVIFKPQDEKFAHHSVEVEGFRKQVDRAFEDACVPWRLRELYRTQNQGFHYFFSAGGGASENWFHRAIILVFTPVGIQDL